MSCQTCYNLQYGISVSYLVPAGLAINTNYYLFVYKPNSNVFTYPITTDSNGSFTIDSTRFPSGFFNEYGGDYEIQITSDKQGQNVVNMMFSVNSYPCLLLNFFCCGDSSDPNYLLLEDDNPLSI